MSHNMATLSATATSPASAALPSVKAASLELSSLAAKVSRAEQSTPDDVPNIMIRRADGRRFSDDNGSVNKLTNYVAFKSPFATRMATTEKVTRVYSADDIDMLKQASKPIRVTDAVADGCGPVFAAHVNRHLPPAKPAPNLAPHL